MINPIRLSIFLTSLVVLQGQTRVDLSAQSQKPNLSANGSTFPIQRGSALPISCLAGQMFYLDTAPAGSAIHVCYSANNWTALKAELLPASTGLANYVLSTNGTTSSWEQFGGDVTGRVNTTQVVRLMGRPLATSTPQDRQYLMWNASFGRWEASSTGQPNFAKSFTAQTQVAISGAEHAFGTSNLVVSCYDNGEPAAQLTPGSVSINQATFEILVNFAVARTGRCVVNGSGGTASDGVKQLISGKGIQVTVSQQASQLAVDTAVVPVFLTEKAIVSFAAIPAGQCGAGTLALTGAILSDAITPGWPAALPGGLVGQMKVSTPGSIAIQLCNLTSSAIAAFNEEFRALIVRGF